VRTNPFPEENWDWLDVTWQGANSAQINDLTQPLIDMFKLNITGITGDINMMAAANALPHVFGGQQDFRQLGTNDPASSMLRTIPEEAFEWYPYALDYLMGSHVIRGQYDATGYWWGFPRYRDDNTRVNYLRTVWAYRVDFAEAVGFPRSWTPKTMTDMAELWQALSDGDPAGNGRQVYGLSGTIWSPHMAPWVNFRHWVWEDNRWILGELSWAAYEGLLFYNRLVRSGAMDPEFTLQGRGTIGELIQGNVGTALVQNQQFDGQNVFNWHNQFRSAHPDLDPMEELRFVPILQKDAQSQGFAAQYPNDEHRTVFSADVSDELMYRLLAITEWAATPEGRDYINYGVPGRDWELVNGQAVNLIPNNALIFAAGHDGAFNSFPAVGPFGHLAHGIQPEHPRALPLWGQYFNDLFHQTNATLRDHLRPMENLEIVTVRLPDGIQFTAGPPARESDRHEIIATATSDSEFRSMWDAMLQRYERNNGLALFYEWSNRAWRENFGG
jgi:hypothetical protein